MSRNSGIPGTSQVEILDSVERVLRGTLPGDWQVTSVQQPRPRSADLVLTITSPAGDVAVVLVEVKSAVEPRDVDSVAEQIKAFGPSDAAVVAAPFLSPITRELLAARGLGWFDPTGNLRLVVARPSILIDREGADRDPRPQREARRLRSLKGPGAAKTVLTLCDAELPVGVRRLAELAGVSPSTGARVLDLLDREALVERTPDGVVVDVRKRSLVRRWTTDYRLLDTNPVVVPALDPRGLDHALSALVNSGVRSTATGSAAQRIYLPSGVVPVSPLMSLIVYADNAAVLMRDIGLREAGRGANVLVVQPFDEVVHDRAHVVDGVRYAEPAQVVADLLTGPGRSTEEADQLLDALAAQDSWWAA